MNDDELEVLLSDLESDRVERKSALSEPDEVREAICAYANDMPGHAQPGVVFVGVDDQGRPTGLPVTDDLLLKLAHMRDDGLIVPIPSVSVSKRSLRGTDVAVVVVQPSLAPPIRFRGRTWIRVGPRRALATPEEERRLSERRRGRDLPFELQAVPGATLSDLDLDFFRQSYLPGAVAPEVLAQNRRTLEDQLRALRFLTPAGEPTVLGILVLGRDPRRYLPCAYVQFVRFDGRLLTDPVRDQKEIDGPVSELLLRLDEVLGANNSVGASFTSGPVEVRSPEYPIPALQQLTRNAVLHRTYEGTNSPVRVYWFEDRIEIQSPGGPYGLVSLTAFGNPGVTDYRNPHLGEALRVLGFVQKFGVGIQIARAELEKNGNPRLDFTVEPTHLLAVIPETGVNVPVVAFFNNKGGVGKTSLVYHLAWMYSDRGTRVLAADLDPQANLTAAFLDEEALERLWDRDRHEARGTVYGAIEPLLRGVGDISDTPPIEEISEKLFLLAGDLALARFEDELSQQWPHCNDGKERAFRVISAFWRLVQMGARASGASLVLLDLGPNLGAINRAALVAADFLVIPLSPDLFSLQGLRNLGPTLRQWRSEWKDRLKKNPEPSLALPPGRIEPLGYVVMQHAIRLDRPVRAYDRWVRRIPVEYASSVIQEDPPATPDDRHCIGMVRHFRSLVPMAQEARKPMFHLTPADGAIGSHADAVLNSRTTFEALAEAIERKVAERVERGR